MMQAWSDYLDELREVGKVLPLTKAWAEGLPIGPARQNRRGFPLIRTAYCHGLAKVLACPRRGELHMTSEPQEIASGKNLAAKSSEVDFAIVLSRVIASIESDPAQLRSAVYELARIKLQTELSTNVSDRRDLDWPSSPRSSVLRLSPRSMIT
jgi:hypothetical protein